MSTYLVRAGWMWTGDRQLGSLRDSYLLVDKEKIAGVGPWKDRPRRKSLKEKDYSTGIVMPGLFNLHGHLAMTLLKGLGETAELQTWLDQYIFPVEKKMMSRQFVADGTELACFESVRAGVSFVTDMYYFGDASAKVIERFGLRALIGCGYFDQGGWDTKSLDESFSRAKKLAQKFKKHPRIQVALAPHAPYTCSVRTLKETAQLAKDLDVGVMIHTAETKKELTDIKRQTGVTPVGILEQTGILKSKFSLLAHSIWLEDHDLQVLARPSITCVLNSKCNAKIASGFPPVGKMKASRVRWALGTDSAATNNSLDLFSEMNFLARTHRLLSGQLSEITPRDLLEAATIRAAEAVGLQHQTGSLTPGKSADFIVLDAQAAHLIPLRDLEAGLVFSARSSDVVSHFIGGKALMDHRKLFVSGESKCFRHSGRRYDNLPGIGV